MKFGFSRRARAVAGLLRFLSALLAGAALLALAGCPNPAAGGPDPNDLKVTATPSGSTVEVKWTAPTDEGQVTEYILRLRDKDGKAVRFDGGGRTNISEVKIQKTPGGGGKYSFTMTVQAIGEFYPEVIVVNLENKELPAQKPAAPVKVTTLASPPSAPGGLRIAGHFFDENNPNRQTAELSWTAPDPGRKANGDPAALAAYTVYWAEGSSVDKTADMKETINPERAGAAPATTLRIDGFTLDAGKEYAFIVTASNDAVTDGLESGAGTAATKPALDFAVRDLRATVKDNEVTVSWTALSGNPEAKSYKVYFKPQAGDAVTATVGQGEGTITYTHRLGKGIYAIEVTVLRSDGTESNPAKVSEPVEVTSTSVFLNYKSDAALQGQADKFSLGDFDHDRLFSAGGLGDYTGQTIKQKVSVKVGDTEKHAGTPRDLAVDAQGNSAHFGIGGMTYATWAGIDDNTDVTITIELTAAGGTQIASETLTKKKTPDGDIRTWRDLQNMKHKLEGSYTIRNDIGFPAKNTEGFESFAPVGVKSNHKRNRFTGSLDGGGKTVSGLYVNSTAQGAGLFGVIDDGEVKNLRLVDPEVRGNSSVGAFAGELMGSAALRRVEASRATGTMVGGSTNVGGLAGYTFNNSTASIIGAVAGTVTGTGGSVGGLIGLGRSGTVIGIASGQVSGTSATVGGLAGSATGNVSGYWDKASTGQTASAGGGTGISKTAEVTYRYGRYFDGETEVFNDAEWHKYFHLPKEGGKWPRLAMDSSTPPAAPALKAIKNADVTTENNKNIIKLSWDAPAASGKTAGGGDATISQYTVYWRAEGGQTGTQTLAGAATKTASIANLDSGKSHTFTVTATNSAGRESLHSVEQTVTDIVISYKSDGSLSGHGDKFSLGDFDGTRLFKAVGLVNYAGGKIKGKVSVEAGTVKHDGTAADINVDARGEAHFGIAGMSYGTWAGITDNANVTIRVELTASGGTAIKTLTFTKKKTPVGDIHTWRDLQNMKHKLDGSYTLQDNISFPEKDTQGFKTFEPIAWKDTDSNTAGFQGAFSGSLDGNGKTITGLYIRGEGNLGLFGYISAAAKDTVVVRNLTMDKPDIQGTENNMGSVAGILFKGSIIDVAAENVKVGGNLGGGNQGGGLVGWVRSNGVLEGEFRSGLVAGPAAIGGLAGANGGTVRGVAKGRVLASRDFHIIGQDGNWGGGLVGDNWGTVMGRSSATVGGHNHIGGLVGRNQNTVWGVFSGEVKASGFAGGLVGHNKRGTVYGVASAGARVSVESQWTGGLVGWNTDGTEVRGWSAAAVSGSSGATLEHIGGLVGQNSGPGDKVQGYALGYVSSPSTTGIGAAIGDNDNDTDGEVVVFVGRTQAEKTANDDAAGSGDHVGVISETALTGVQRTSSDVGTAIVESTTAPTLTGLSYGTDPGEWKTEAGKRWPVLIFPADFPADSPGGQPAQDPKIPDKPANFYE